MRIARLFARYARSLRSPASAARSPIRSAARARQRLHVRQHARERHHPSRQRRRARRRAAGGYGRAAVARDASRRDPQAVDASRSASSINTSADADHIGSNEVLLKPAPELTSYRPKWRCSRRTMCCSGEPRWIGSVRPAPGRRSRIWRERASRSTARPFRCSPRKPRTPTATASCCFAARTCSAPAIFSSPPAIPVIDLERGGSIQGEIRALNHILDLTVPRSMQEGGTMVIPGHGRLCDEVRSDRLSRHAHHHSRSRPGHAAQGQDAGRGESGAIEPGLRSALQHQRVDRRYVRRSDLSEPRAQMTRRLLLASLAFWPACVRRADAAGRLVSASNSPDRLTGYWVVARHRRLAVSHAERARRAITTASR